MFSPVARLKRVLLWSFTRRPHTVRKLRPLGIEALEDRVVPAAINGVAFFDLNANGNQDTGEGVAAGIGVDISPSSGSSITVYTNGSGYYEASGLAPDWYTVRVDPPVGYGVSTPAGGTTTVEITADEDVIGVGVGLVDESGSSSGSGSGSGLPVISVTPTNAAEGDKATVTFTRTGGDLSQPLTIAFDIGGTATPGNPGDPGADYQALSGMVTFDPYSGTAVADIFTFADDVYDPDETVTLTIYPTDEYTLLGNAGSDMAVAVITEPTSPPPPPPPAGGWWVEADTDEVVRGEETTFSVETDADPWPNVTLYEWDLDYDGMTFQPDAAAGNDWYATTTFTSAGARTVAARLTDDQGNIAVVTDYVTVDNPPPVLTVPTTDLETAVGVGTPLQVTATSDVGITSVEWWFSYDGEDYEEEPSLADYTPTNTYTSPAYTFDTYGDYDAWVVVTDADGHSSEDGFHVVVDEVPPTLTVTVSGPVDEGSPTVFTVSDIDPDILDTVTIYANWGDNGQTEEEDPGDWEVNWTENPDGSVSFQHTYDRDGTYPATIRVEDDGGQLTDGTVTAVVNDVMPQATFTAGTQIATTDSDAAAENVWAVQPGQNLQFQNVIIPGEFDAEGVKYHWTITDTWGGIATIDETNDKSEMALPDYSTGRVYQVEAWVIDGGGNETPHASGWVVVDGPAYQDEQGVGSGEMAAKVYGSLYVDPDGIIPHYNRFGYAPLVQKPDWNGSDPLTIRYQLDDASLAYIQRMGYTVVYHYQVTIYDVEQTTFWGDAHDVLSSDSYDSPGSLIIGPLPTDRQVEITGGALLFKDGVQVGYSPYGRVIAITPGTPTTWQQVTDILSGIQTLVQSFGDSADAIYQAIYNNAGGFLSTLQAGFQGAVSQFFTDLQAHPLDTLGQAVAQWLRDKAGVDLTAFQNLDWTKPDAVLAFLLQYSGLTWDHVYQVVQQKVGAGNLAALEQAAGWFAGTDPADPIGITTLVNNLSAAGSQVAGVSWTDIQKQLTDNLKDQLLAASARAVPQLLAKFVPGVGGLRSLYQALSWVVANAGQLGDLFAAFSQAVAAAAGGTADDVKNKLLAAFEGQLLPKALDFAAAQLGISRLPADLKKALAFVPTQVDTALRKAVDSIASTVRGAAGLAGGTAQAQSTGKLAPERQFDYGGKTYVLWVAQDKSTGRATVKVAIKGGKFVGDLSTKSFTTAVMADGQTAQAHIGALVNAAQALARQAKPVSGQKPTKDTMTNLVNLQRAVSAAEDKVVADILANACVALNAGCFAAGTRLLTRDGWRNVEDIQPGEWVLSRDEHDPLAVPEWKPVEGAFRRTGCILHLHIEGEVIRTTPEHPFFVAGEGWTAAGSLQPGDRVATLSGEWVAVGEVYDTGEWEPVYNLRVADHHTYFVGDDHWAFAAWAHNAYSWTPTGNTYPAGRYNTVADKDGGSGYSRPWWKPSTVSPPTRLQSDPCTDRTTQLGDRLQTSAQQFADGWTAQSQSARYGTRLNSTIIPLLETINGFLSADGQATLTLDQIDQQGQRFPALSSSNAEYNTAVEQFWFHRSVSIGWYVHTKVEDAFQNEPGLTSSPPGAAGPDFTYTTPAGKTVYFEILPDTTAGRAAHARRGMKTYLWRAVYYNRTAINNAGSQEPGFEDPGQF